MKKFLEEWGPTIFVVWAVLLVTALIGVFIVAILSAANGC